MPVAVHEPREVAALREVHHERVTIDVVAGVLLVEPRHRPAFPRRTLLLLVPVGDQPLAVGVQRRDEYHHDVLQHRQRLRVGGGDQRVQELACCLRGPDLRRVDAAADGDDHLLRRRQAPGLVGLERARIGQAEVGRADLVEVADVLRRAHHGGRRRMPLGGAAEVDQLHAIGLRRDEREVAGDVVSGRETTVGSEAETEVGVWRGNLGRNRRGEREQPTQHQGARPGTRHRRMIAERLLRSRSRRSSSASSSRRTSSAAKPHCSGS